MNPQAFCSDLGLLSRLLDEGMEAGPAAMEAWLGGLVGNARRLASPLRDMLSRHWADADTGWIDALPALVERQQPAPARAGDRVGPWVLLRELGSGGMASVWLAERTDAAGSSPRRRAALKLPHLLNGTDDARRMHDEIAISVLMQHPNVGRVIDAGVDAAQRPFLALAPIDGVPLLDWCRLQQPNRQQRLRLFLQLARAVGYIHGRGVVHRDLKPCNVLVSRGGQVHVIDFGIAIRADAPPACDDSGRAARRPRSLTPGYASPEQAGGGDTGFASDVYSLALVLLELLTGRRVATTLCADDVRTTAAVAHDGWRQAAIACAGLPDACAGVLARALAWQPEQRYANAAHFADAVQSALPGVHRCAVPAAG